MITDTPGWSDGENVEADLCIVGGGLIGLAIARSFLDTSLRVLVLEAGGWHPTRRGQDDLWAETAGMPNHSFAHSRFRSYGGSGVKWTGLCPPLEPLDLDGSVTGDRWPVTHGELEPWFREAEHFLDIPTPATDLAAWEKRIGRIPSLGPDLRPVVMPAARRRDLGAAFRESLNASPNVRVVLGADVLSIETGPDGHRVETLRVALPGAREVRCRAQDVVLAAGGVENARLLLLSNHRFPAGLGNGYNQVGRRFMDHVYCNAGYLEPASPEAARGPNIIDGFAGLNAIAGHSLGENIRRRDGLNGAAAFFVRRPAHELTPEFDAPGGRALNYFAEVVRGERFADRRAMAQASAVVRHMPSVMRLGRAHLRGIARPEQRIALRMQIEATPDSESRVTLASTKDRHGRPRARVDWRVPPSDLEGASRLWTALADGLSQNGHGRLVGAPPGTGGDWPASTIGGKHHMGTTRMSDDPRHGVVDRNGRVHGIANLHIAGSSVFPTGGWANPTLTALALSLRLAANLRKR